MRAKYYIPILLFFPVLVIQITVIPLIAINGIIPDLIIILLVFYTMRNNQIYGTVLGFIFGFLFDLLTGTLLGSSMLAKTTSGFIAGYFSNENKRENYFKSYNFALIVLLCSVLNSVIISFFSSVDVNTNLVAMIFQLGLLPGFYTSIISLIIIIFYPRRSFS
ncbi:MAG TPA: rod shape-determining protein MreD [Ignavibacteriaceae bacterium]|nr:rod shape-determining protein MreD [Ignavibacteriaceae bacterium]